MQTARLTERLPDHPPQKAKAELARNISNSNVSPRRGNPNAPLRHSLTTFLARFSGINHHPRAALNSLRQERLRWVVVPSNGVKGAGNGSMWAVGRVNGGSADNDRPPPMGLTRCPKWL